MAIPHTQMYKTFISETIDDGSIAIAQFSQCLNVHFIVIEYLINFTYTFTYKFSYFFQIN